MVSLDSSYLIDLLYGEEDAVVKARELDSLSEPRYISAPAAAEVLIGGYRLGGAYLERTRAIVDGLPMLLFDLEAAHVAGRLGAEMRRRGTNVGQGDLLIAAISMRHGQRLLSRDKVFPRLPGLETRSY